MRTTSTAFVAVFALVQLAVQQPASAQRQAYSTVGAYGQAPAIAYTGYTSQSYAPQGCTSGISAPQPYVPPSYVTPVAMQLQPTQNELGTVCDDYCPDCCCECCCCDPKFLVFGEFLYLRPRNAEVAYAVAVNGAVVPPPAPPIQVAPIALVDPDYNPGFRVGIGHAVDVSNSISVAYTYYESQQQDATATTAPNIIASLVSHPSSASAATPFLRASANYGLDFELIDLDYRGMFSSSERHVLNYLIGARYGCLRQDLVAQFFTNNVETVSTLSNFDGGGIRVGLEGERYSPSGAWMVYGRGAASFVGGEFRARYIQDDLLGTRIVDTAWTSGRLVTMLDLEVGVGWVNASENWRLSAGYMVSGWFNVVKTDQWIKAVQGNNFVGLSDTLTFDGLVARAELRF